MHVVFVQTFDVQTHVISWIGEVDTAVVHLDGKYLACAWIRCSVRRQEDDFFSWLYLTLFYTPSKHITDTFDLVDTRDRHAHWRTDRALRNTAKLVKDVVHGLTQDGLLTAFDPC